MEFKNNLTCGVRPHDNGKPVCLTCYTCIDCLLSLQGSLEFHVECCEKTEDIQMVKKILEDMVKITILPIVEKEEFRKKKSSGCIKKIPALNCQSYTGISASMVEEDDFL